jgi:hypothetical protein
MLITPFFFILADFSGPVYAAVDLMARLSEVGCDVGKIAKVIIKLCVLTKTHQAYTDLFVRVSFI